MRTDHGQRTASISVPSAYCTVLYNLISNLRFHIGAFYTTLPGNFSDREKNEPARTMARTVTPRRKGQFYSPLAHEVSLSESNLTCDRSLCKGHQVDCRTCHE